MITLKNNKNNFSIGNNQESITYSKVYYEYHGDLLPNGTLTVVLKDNQSIISQYTVENEKN